MGPSRYDLERNIILPKEYSTDFAYLLGVLAGDGHLSKEDYNICCSGNPADEKEFYDFVLKKLILKTFNYSPKMKHFSGGTYGFRFGSKLIQTHLTTKWDLPKGKKYNSLKVPEKIKNNKKLEKKFIIGLADTDFGFCLKKRYRKFHYYPVLCMSSKSESFTKEIKEILDKEEIKTTNIHKALHLDERLKKGYSVEYKFDMNGYRVLEQWMKKFGFKNPKHIRTYRKYLKIMKKIKD